MEIPYDIRNKIAVKEATPNKANDKLVLEREFEIDKELGLKIKRTGTNGNKIRDCFEIIKMIFSEEQLEQKTVKEILEANERYYLITLKNETIGCIGFELCSGKICSAYIKPQYRHAGFMEKTLKALIEQNTIVRFATTINNTPMINFAAKLGFKQIEKLENAVIYEKVNQRR